MIGLLVLTKHFGILVQVFCLLLLVWFLIKGEKTRIKQLSTILALSLVVSSYTLGESLRLVWLTVRSLLPFPPGPESLDFLLRKEMVSFWSSPGNLFWRRIFWWYGSVVFWALGITLFYFLKYRQKSRCSLLFILFVFLALSLSLTPAIQIRHFLTLIPLIALLGSISLGELIKRKKTITILTVLLLVINIYCVFHIPNYRVWINLDLFSREAFAFLKEKVPPETSILSAWTYNTFFYTGRKATWPLAGTPSSPSELFYEKDSSRFYSLLDKYGIGYILVDKRRIGKEFNTFNYPLLLIENLEELGKSGKARTVYDSNHFKIIEFLKPEVTG